MRGYRYGCGLWLMALSCWVHGAVADPAASAASATAASASAVSAVKVVRSPEETYQLGVKALDDENLSDAIMLFMRAGESGHAAAQVKTAELLEEGSSVKLALEWWRKAADQGYAPGQFGLAKLYATPSREGFVQDNAEARKWFALAANQGYAPAILVLAGAYMGAKMKLGLDAAALSSPEALVWIKRAADINNVDATRALANAYRSGLYGLAVDPAQADVWDAKLKEMTAVKEDKKKKHR